jgi:hypothetical protein
MNHCTADGVDLAKGLFGACSSASLTHVWSQPMISIIGWSAPRLGDVRESAAEALQYQQPAG